MVPEKGNRFPITEKDAPLYQGTIARFVQEEMCKMIGRVIWDDIGQAVIYCAGNNKTVFRFFVISRFGKRSLPFQAVNFRLLCRRLPL